MDGSGMALREPGAVGESRLTSSSDAGLNMSTSLSGLFDTAMAFLIPLGVDWEVDFDLDFEFECTSNLKTWFIACCRDHY